MYRRRFRKRFYRGGRRNFVKRRAFARKKKFGRLIMRKAITAQGTLRQNNILIRQLLNGLRDTIISDINQIDNAPNMVNENKTTSAEILENPENPPVLKECETVDPK
jgi:hypothetical protein